MKFWKIVLASLIAFILGIVGIFVYLIGAGISALMSMTPLTTPTEQSSVLVVDLGENIVDAPQLSPLSGFDPTTLTLSESISLLEVITAIEHAAQNPAIKGLCIHLDGTGTLSAAAIEELRTAINNHFKAAGKFVVAYDDNYTQSEYYLASVADHVMLQPEGSLDWRGVGFSLTFFKGLFDKIGAEVEVFRPTVCKYKSAVEPYILSEMSPANREQMESLAQSMWSTIASSVAESRKLDTDTVKQLAANMSIATAEDALKYGFVDRLAYEDELYDYLAQQGVELTECGTAASITLGSYVAQYLAGNTHKVAMGNDSDYKKFGNDNLVALIYAEGQIIDGGDIVEGKVTGASLADQLRQARLNDATKAVVVRVNSPGGSALASDIAWREMTLLQQTKPVVISMGDMAASGGYYISAPADRIITNNLTLTGSIGVYGMIPNIGNTLKNKLGITLDEAATSPSATGMSLIKPLTPQQRAVLTTGVDKVYATFTEHVAEGRNMSLDEVYNVAEGRVWSGTQAVERGLADGIGGLAQAIYTASELADLGNDYTLYEFSVALTPFEEWLNTMGGMFGARYGIDMTIHGAELNTLFERCPHLFTHSGIQTIIPYNLKFNF